MFLSFHDKTKFQLFSHFIFPGYLSSRRCIFYPIERGGSKENGRIECRKSKINMNKGRANKYRGGSFISRPTTGWHILLALTVPVHPFANERPHVGLYWLFDCYHTEMLIVRTIYVPTFRTISSLLLLRDSWNFKSQLRRWRNLF